jgi:site-specific DNA-cytosine methylase
MSAPRKYTVGFLASGLGAGAMGFQRALGRLGPDTAAFRSLGGVDIDPASCRDFELLTGSPALCADLHELTPAQLIAFMGEETPDAIFTSSPCKGFSGLLSAKKALEEKYQRLNLLFLKSAFLSVETWRRPPKLLVFENVPRIVTRGADLLAKTRQLLGRYGYVFHEATHDCGEVGGLAQHRKRYLLVARHEKTCTAYVYKPPKLRVRGCGEVLGELPMPTDPDAGRLHQMPKISWLNWVRLALIPAGGDWRDLPKVIEPQAANPAKFTNKLKMLGWEQPSPSVIGGSDLLDGNPSVADPRLAEALGLPADTFPSVLGVNAWTDPTGVITGQSRPMNGKFSVADPRIAGFRAFSGALGVGKWADPSGAVTGEALPTTGRFSVADPRLLEMIALGRAGTRASSFKGRPGMFGVNEWDEPAPTVTGRVSVSGGTTVAAVADPRITSPVPEGAQKRSVHSRYDVRGWEQAARTIAGSGSNGGYGVADPRVLEAVQLGCAPRSGVYGVIGWEQAAATVTGSASIDNGACAVADPRKAPEQLVIVVASDGTWHRPITRLEFAALQGLPTTINGKPLDLAGTLSSVQERIGNAVPVGAGRAIAESLLTALLATDVGGWALGGTGIWVRERDGWAQEATEYEIGGVA